MTEHRIIQGDVLAGLATLPDNSVQCTVSSPPYWMLRNYGVDGQIGLEETMDAYIQKIVDVFHEVKRVTREDGVLWLNLGDGYAGGGKGPTGKNGIGNQEERQGFVNVKRNHSATPGTMKDKDLMGIPWRVAFALQNDGWYLRSAIPWIKRNCMPESTTDRPTSAIEYVFLMAKSAKYFYDGDAVRVPSSESYQNDSRPQGVLRQRVNKNSKYPNEGQFKRIDPEFEVVGGLNVAVPHKQDQTGNPTYTGFNERWKGKKVDALPERDNKHAATMAALRGHSGILKADGTPFCDGVTRNYRNSDPFFESWQGLYSESENPLAFVINPQSRPELHFATFPDLLAETCIKAGTSERGCCPKCGKPWERIVEVTGGTIGESWHPHADDEVTGQSLSSEKLMTARNGSYKREQKGWKPGCKCDAGEPVPCAVLDPFLGSGTTMRIARDLGRSSVGIEINPAYIKIARKLLQADSQLDTGVVSYRFEEVTG